MVDAEGFDIRDALKLEEIKEMITSDYKEFSYQVCQRVLSCDDDLLTNKLVNEKYKSSNPYKELARIVLKVLQKEKVNKKDSEVVGYISARKWIENQISLLLVNPDDYKSPFFNHICSAFFTPYMGQIENQSALFNYMIHYGVPAYTQMNKDYELLKETSELYCYLKVSGKYALGFYSHRMPAWVDEVFINTEHEKWHYQLYTEVPKSELDEEQQTILRARYRQMIGVPMQGKDNNTAYGTDSKLSKLVQQVVNRYYGVNFDVNDSDTWAKQKDIVEWLMKEHSLSKREAEAIDLVTRPDAARKK